jgi:hypothetical protein
MNAPMLSIGGSKDVLRFIFEAQPTPGGIVLEGSQQPRQIASHPTPDSTITIRAKTSVCHRDPEPDSTTACPKGTHPGGVASTTPRGVTPLGLQQPSHLLDQRNL